MLSTILILSASTNLVLGLLVKTAYNRIIKLQSNVDRLKGLVKIKDDEIKNYKENENKIIKEYKELEKNYEKSETKTNRFVAMHHLMVKAVKEKVGITTNYKITKRFQELKEKNNIN